MKKLFLLLILLWPLWLWAQNTDSLNLDDCQKQARENYPLLKQKNLLSDAADLRIRNFNKNWYPQLFLNAQATYQSDVTQISIPIPNLQMPEMDKDMYKITLDVNQTIYDGSATSWQKSIERLSLKADEQSVEVEMNKIRERINQIYFNILLFQENEKLILNMQDEIRSKLHKVEAAVKNEAMLQNNADILQAEILKTDQQLIEIRAGKEGAVKMLGEYLNKEIPVSTGFKTPATVAVITGGSNIRPEMQWYDLQIDKLEATKKLSTSKILPRLSFFGQAGYGRPGLNMLDSEFNDWYMAGLKLSWNIWNWNLSTNERKIVEVQKNILLTQKETFDKNVSVAVQKDLVDIQKYDELIAKDKDIVALREKIAENFSFQFDNGIVTATEYTTELNNTAQAKLNMQLHKIQQQMAVASYLFNSGK
jgi:outer membrane protein TolC